ncbi:MAG TPA: LON peptidase substrate-binding domain-containing protein [Gemmataceae bacterium]|nr:LON peptidase substrate-binding domain-containing protein [Gemmataceae bacterium]
MSDDTSVPDDFSGQVRLFPLPDLVLFPYVIQPLHIFEPRYRELMADALQDDRLMALATLKPGSQEDYDKRPPIYPVICIGRIIKEELLPDGRYNLLLHGLCRARIVEELPADKLYRTARVTVLEEVPIVSLAVEQELRQKLSDHLNTWFASQSATLAQVRKMLEGDLPLGTLCDIFSFTLNIDVVVKQQLLEQLDIEQRTRHLLDYLAPRLPTKLVAMPPRRFPPDFSTN